MSQINQQGPLCPESPVYEPLTPHPSPDLRIVAFTQGGQHNKECFEVMALRDGQIGLRDSKHPEVSHLTFTRAEMAAWIKGVKAGEFDDLC